MTTILSDTRKAVWDLLFPESEESKNKKKIKIFENDDMISKRIDYHSGKQVDGKHDMESQTTLKNKTEAELDDSLSMEEILQSIRRIIDEESQGEKVKNEPEKNNIVTKEDKEDSENIQLDVVDKQSAQAPSWKEDILKLPDNLSTQEVLSHIAQQMGHLSKQKSDDALPPIPQEVAMKGDAKEILEGTEASPFVASSMDFSPEPIAQSEIPEFLKNFREEQMASEEKMQNIHKTDNNVPEQGVSPSEDIKPYNILSRPGYEDKPDVLRLTQMMQPDGTISNTSKQVASINNALPETADSTSIPEGQQRHALLESLVIRCLQPMLKDWMHQNIEKIVTSVIREELSKRIENE